MFKIKSILKSQVAVSVLFMVALAPMKIAASDLPVQSIMVLLGVKSSLDSDTSVKLFKIWKPDLSENKIRVAHAGLMASILAGVHVCMWQLDSQIKKDYEALAYHVGEFLSGYVVAHFYFRQPFLPGQNL